MLGSTANPLFAPGSMMLALSSVTMFWSLRSPLTLKLLMPAPAVWKPDPFEKSANPAPGAPGIPVPPTTPGKSVSNSIASRPTVVVF